MDHKSLRRQAVSDHNTRVKDRRGESPSDAAADSARIRKAFSEHDSQLHGGSKTRLALKDGGCADGGPAAPRLDRPGRARGGKSPNAKKGTTVNVVVASGKGEDRPVPVPVPAAGGPPPRPPMPPPGAMGPGGPPMGGPPGMGGPPPGLGGPPGMGPPRPPMMPMRADGGKTVAVHMTAGAGSGEGRLDKAKMKIPDENAAD